MTSHTPTIFDGILRGLSRPPVKPVYPGYLASRVKRGLLSAQTADPERIIATVGDIETVGDCRYAIVVTDDEGNRYRITVEVL